MGLTNGNVQIWISQMQKPYNIYTIILYYFTFVTRCLQPCNNVENIANPQCSQAAVNKVDKVVISRWETLANLLFSFGKKDFRMSRSAKRLLIVSTNLDGFSLVNHEHLAKFAQLFPPNFSSIQYTFPFNIQSTLYQQQVIIVPDKCKICVYSSLLCSCTFKDHYA